MDRPEISRHAKAGRKRSAAGTPTDVRMTQSAPRGPGKAKQTPSTCSQNRPTAARVASGFVPSRKTASPSTSRANRSPSTSGSGRRNACHAAVRPTKRPCAGKATPGCSEISSGRTPVTRSHQSSRVWAAYHSSVSGVAGSTTGTQAPASNNPPARKVTASSKRQLKAKRRGIGQIVRARKRRAR